MPVKFLGHDVGAGAGPKPPLQATTNAASAATHRRMESMSAAPREEST